ncbi:MAG: magnesium chelatase [Rubricoccaceae bacterium]|nr:magnesium chelatase [Rubricoccaceae bacterium]
MSSPPDLQTLGQLKAAGYRPRSVKDELRANLIRTLRAGEEVLPGVLGYEQTVLPQLQHALLARHDFILLGLRGQAKSRILRLLPRLLDEWVPEVEGSEIHDDPFHPVSKHARELVAQCGDATPIAWLHRSARYGEKLATPDTSIADLIGDIDPIKAATQKLTYADEEVIHFGIIPRTNRGIFAINELPDLQPRIQVGLLNIMEEQDVQIRGFNVRIPLDLQMVFTANPEDYTNRGAIITPLKDRIDSQILTHYPRRLEVGVAITQQEAWQERSGDAVPTVHVPHYVREVVEQIAFEARESEYVDQKSGVSARLTRAALEDVLSAAERRALLNGEPETTVRPSDLYAAEPAVTGKVELVYEGEQEGAQAVAQALIGKAVAAIFKRYFPDPADKAEGRQAYADVLGWFAKGHDVELEPAMPFDAYAKALDAVDGLREVVRTHSNPASPAEAASAMELVLEALHQHSLLGKDRLEEGGRAKFGDLMGSVLGQIGSFGDDEDDDFEDYRRRYS